MARTSGSKLGPYEIVSFIGAGGMGEVYKARDLRLGREVALKVLPASFAADDDRLRRFEQEARAVAALNHPNILAVHDLGQHEGSPFLVSELLDGESLGEILSRGPLSHRRTIDYAVQIAHGLAAAHSKDIVHRDLKPDNIFITREGRVKILDFGLAKTVAKPTVRGQNAGMATMTAAGPATEVGTVVGTAGYMSPEQVRGGAVDSRTDIFSFGAVLYEMVTGQRAFKRDTTADTMAAILNDDPSELLESGRQIPAALDRIVRHCLEKAPEQRFQSARDLAFDLESVTTLTSSGNLATVKAKQRRKWLYAAAGAAVMAIAVAVGWAISAAYRPVVGPQFHQLTYRSGVPGDARFTPDGQNVIYTASWQGSTPELYTVSAAGTGGHPLGIRNARLLAVSRRGELAVALQPNELTNVVAPGTLARTADITGAPKPEIENVQAADFTPDGSALAIVRYLPADRTCQVEYPIGKVLYHDMAIDSLRFSPDGRYLAFITHGLYGDDRGQAIILRSSGEKIATSPLYESVQGLAWTPSGQEIWTTSPLESGEIHALTTSGKVRQPLAVPGRLRLLDIGADGQLLVGQGTYRRGMIVSHDQTAQDASWLDFGLLRDISRDGKTILFEEEGNQTRNYTVFVRQMDGSPAVPLGEGYAVALSPDKKWALAEKLTTPGEMWLLPVGPGEARRLNPPKLSSVNIGAFFSDGRRVVYMAQETGHGSRVWLQDLSGGDPRPITEEDTIGFMLSTDDKWLLVNRNIGGPVLVPATGGKPQSVMGLKATENVLGWTGDGQLYAASAADNAQVRTGNDERSVAVAIKLHIDKLNPHTGTRTVWRDLVMPPIQGVYPDAPIITPDGATFAFGYRLLLSDLYTVSGVR